MIRPINAYHAQLTKTKDYEDKQTDFGGNCRRFSGRCMCGDMPKV
jgi:hypothetical protein